LIGARNQKHTLVKIDNSRSPPTAEQLQQIKLSKKFGVRNPSNLIPR
jgi:hypothetical protein